MNIHGTRVCGTHGAGVFFVPFFVCLLILAVVGRASAVEYTFHAIDYPDATDDSGTIMAGVNNHGLALGTYYADEDDFGTAFFWQNGVFSEPVGPEFELADLLAINDVNQMAGYAFDDAGIFGFISDGEEIDTFVIAPDPVLGASFAAPTSMSLEDDGTIVGGYFDLFLEESGVFRRSGEGVEVLFASAEDFIYVARANRAGTIVGSAEKPDGDFYAFVLGETGPEPFLHPDGATELYDINDSGVMVGNVTPLFGAPRGFLYQDGVFTDVIFPGADLTYVSAVNDRGWLVGEFGTLDSDKLTGFIAIPIPEPHGVMLATLALAGLLGRVRYRRR